MDLNQNHHFNPNKESAAFKLAILIRKTFTIFLQMDNGKKFTIVSLIE